MQWINWICSELIDLKIISDKKIPVGPLSIKYKGNMDGLFAVLTLPMDVHNGLPRCSYHITVESDYRIYKRNFTIVPFILPLFLSFLLKFHFSFNNRDVRCFNLQQVVFYFFNEQRNFSKNLNLPRQMKCCKRGCWAALCTIITEKTSKELSISEGSQTGSDICCNLHWKGY